MRCMGRAGHEMLYNFSAGWDIINRSPIGKLRVFKTFFGFVRIYFEEPKTRMKDRFNKKAGEFSLAILIIILVFFFLSAEGGRANTDGIDKKSIVKIYTIRSTPNFFLPWSMKSPSSSTGSGCIISGNRILTNAHVVSDQTFIQVRKYGEPNRFRARVLSVAHELDLAILTVDDTGFFEGVSSLEL